MTPKARESSCRGDQPILTSSLAGEGLQIGAALNLAIDVISDVICPWCYIGKKRLERAIGALDGQQVRVRWLPYQLNPSMPKEGISRKEYRIRKFGSWERSLELDAKIIAVGNTEGIHFAFDRIERTPNTVDAHRLIWLADQQGCQNTVVEALFVAYFTEGRDITNRQTLIEVVAEAGLERQFAETMLNGSEGIDEFKEAKELARRYQVGGVPFFIINDKITVSGAQQPEVFLAAFGQASGEM
jgi:predicted DsbA family dithiol-disulfide isomerase